MGDIRSSQRESPTLVGAASGGPAFGANWSADVDGKAPQFYKDRSGLVHLEGVVQNDTDLAAVAAPVFTLPVSHRPVDRMLYWVAANSSTTECVMEVLTNGEVSILQGIITANVHMDGVVFRTP